MTTSPTSSREPVKRRRRLTDRQRENLRIYAVMAYRRGDSIRTICAATRRCHGFIRRLLVTSGVRLRQHRRSQHHPQSGNTASRDDKNSHAEGARR